MSLSKEPEKVGVYLEDRGPVIYSFGLGELLRNQLPPVIKCASDNELTGPISYETRISNQKDLVVMPDGTQIWPGIGRRVPEQEYNKLIEDKLVVPVSPRDSIMHALEDEDKICVDEHFNRDIWNDDMTLFHEDKLDVFRIPCVLPEPWKK